MREGIFAADDWGMSPGINDGILTLARRGWLNSVSMMANAKYLRHGLDSLRRCLGGGVSVSLHFNLTYGKPLATPDAAIVSPVNGEFFGLPHLLRMSLSGRLSPQEIAAEFMAQWRHLTDLGLDVRQVDGHHHVHLLPGVLNVVARLAPACGIPKLRRMEDWAHPFSWAQSALFARATGARGLEWQSCAYLRPGDLAHKRKFLRKLNRAGGRPLVVHPAARDDLRLAGATDRLAGYRVFELRRVCALMKETSA